MTTQRHEFDLCVVGAGSAGYSAAEAARELGRSVAFVEGTGPLAGLCILRGCMPAKTLLHSAEVAHLVENAHEVGVEPKDVAVDVPAIVERKRRIIRNFADSRIEEIKKFPLFCGVTRFTGKRELCVGEATITADKFVLCTGSIISPPPIAGLKEAGYLTSDDFMEIEDPPESIIVIGGGPVGCEFGQYLARLGAKVTLLQDGPTLLRKEDSDIGAALRLGLEKDGIRVLTGVSVLKVSTDGERKRVEIRCDGKIQTLSAGRLMLATGRHANTRGFELEAAGVKYDDDGVAVDEYLQTSNPDIYAAGDVLNGRKLLHMAVYQGRLAVQNAFGCARAPAEYDLQQARSVFTDPQVAVAGLNEAECRQRGLNFKVAKHPFEDLGKAITANCEEGFVKMLTDRAGRILGLAFVGEQASDLIHEAISLLYFKATIDDVLKMPHLHPTMAEIITYPAQQLRSEFAQAG